MASTPSGARRSGARGAGARGSGARPPPPGNAELADALERVAVLLEAQEADPFRVAAWRNAARSVREHRVPVAAIAAERGREGLDGIPHVGRAIAGALEELVRTGSLGMLRRLEGEAGPETLFATLPGVGPALAHRIHETLGVESLAELEVAAHDGRLEAVPGFGRSRVRALRDSLAALLRRGGRGGAVAPVAMAAAPPERPSVAAILAVDADYRRGAEAGRLPRIAPRRFNPEGERWLPVLHQERDGWSFTALFSNTARAHELGKTRDWVVVYYERDGQDGQCTVVTESRGPRRGQRVVRGREQEQSSGVECRAKPSGGR